jgi:hypothetical protein
VVAGQVQTAALDGRAVSGGGLFGVHGLASVDMAEQRGAGGERATQVGAVYMSWLRLAQVVLGAADAGDGDKEFMAPSFSWR